MAIEPLNIDALIDQAAAKYGIDARVLRAMVHQESSGDPMAVSSAGARGLMQLMPDTARSLGVTDPHDPAQNIDAGARYYAQLLKQFGGNQSKALAAYNMGPTALSRGDQLPGETRQYVRKINGRTMGPPAPGKTGLDAFNELLASQQNKKLEPPPSNWGLGDIPTAINAFLNLPSALYEKATAYPSSENLQVNKQGESSFGGRDLGQDLNQFSPMTAIPTFAWRHGVGQAVKKGAPRMYALEDELGAAIGRLQASTPSLALTPESRLLSAFFAAQGGKEAVENAMGVNIDTTKPGMGLGPEDYRKLVRMAEGMFMGVAGAQGVAKKPVISLRPTERSLVPPPVEPGAPSQPAPPANAAEAFNQALGQAQTRASQVKQAIAPEKMLIPAPTGEAPPPRPTSKSLVPQPVPPPIKRPPIPKPINIDRIPVPPSELPPREPGPTERSIIQPPPVKGIKPSKVLDQDFVRPPSDELATPQKQAGVMDRIIDLAKQRGVKSQEELLQLVREVTGRRGSRSTLMSQVIAKQLGLPEKAEAIQPPPAKPYSASEGEPAPTSKSLFDEAEGLLKKPEEPSPKSGAPAPVTSDRYAPESKNWLERNYQKVMDTEAGQALQGLVDEINIRTKNVLSQVLPDVNKAITSRELAIPNYGGYSRPSTLDVPAEQATNLPVGGYRLNLAALIGRAKTPAEALTAIVNTLRHEIVHTSTGALHPEKGTPVEPGAKLFDPALDITKGATEHLDTLFHTPENLKIIEDIQRQMKTLDQVSVDQHEVFGPKLRGEAGSKMEPPPDKVEYLHGGLGAVGPMFGKYVGHQALRKYAQVAAAGRLDTAINNALNTTMRYGMAGVVDALGAPFSKEARSALKGKISALKSVPADLMDAARMAYKNTPQGALTGNAAEAARFAENLSKEWLPSGLHNAMWHLFSSDIQMPGGTSRKPTLVEHAQRVRMAPSIIQERTARLAILRSELQPFMDKIGAKSLEEMWAKSEVDPALKAEAREAFNQATTMALDMTSALPGSTKRVDDIIRHIKGVPFSYLMTDVGLFPRMVFANMVPQMLESNVVTLLGSKRVRNSLIEYPKMKQQLPKLEQDAAQARAQLSQAMSQMKAAVQAAPSPMRSQVRNQLRAAMAPLKQAAKNAKVALNQHQGQMKAIEARGLKGKRQLAELSMTGPITAALFAAKALSEPDDEKEWYHVQTTNGLSKDVRAPIGALAPWALIGHAIGKRVKGSEKYSDEQGYASWRRSIEALTQTRAGGTKVGDIIEAARQAHIAGDQLWTVVQRVGFDLGRLWAFPASMMPGVELGQAVEKKIDPTERTYVANRKSDPFAIGQGMAKQFPGTAKLVEKAEGKPYMEPMYDPYTGQEKRAEAPFRSLVGGGERTVGRLEGFINANSGMLDPAQVLLRPTHYREYDESLYRHFRENIANSRIDAILNGEVSFGSKKSKVLAVVHEMNKVKQLSHVQATKEFVDEDKTDLLPAARLRMGAEQADTIAARKENRGLYRQKRGPARNRLLPWEQREIQEKGKERRDESQ